ncbi:1,4-alpha-glucan branching enzyme [Pelotomaculum thermopropionicum SI]|uniref:Malto-oligosyltrehalose trehalohydrolase n=1 Tax=Pelotomaculum thermopropionicum (strain DSM 13744 / JCM 10971 / SI) TaxID=370438 RepID=A5D1W2_PELTS|nr:1,4-alpha-glucan branching enzyme [Pelotomaculum thermopropionicum SI]
MPCNNISSGATYLGDGFCFFRVWAPRSEKVAVHLLTPQERLIPLQRAERGYHCGKAAGVEPGSLYYYLLDGKKERPDPASRYQPEGVHGPSQVLGRCNFAWTDHGWRGLSLKELIFYEIHVGTFTPQGTFDAIIPRLESIRELGATAIELMPVAQFPGRRNWGYDGVYPFAVQNSYGGPDGLKRLADACHRHGLALFLDVVYNHLGPEGNYLRDFGPYFTDRYRTPWGEAVNFDGPGSNEVRQFFIENALYWLTEYHLDGLRLDAVHAITDKSALPFLEELADAVHRQANELGRRIYLIAESDLNDPRLIWPRERGGLGLDGQWSDDFHHALHSLLTGEKNGYYQDFGTVEHLAGAFREGYVYTGQYSAYRQRRHGKTPGPAGACRFVVFIQNHDQVGNRAGGERLSSLVDFDRLKLAAGTLLLSPFLPLIFMGEEYAETSPFLYFTSHSDPELANSLHEWRKKEFAAFRWSVQVPDPQDETTFLRSCLHYELHREGRHSVLRDFYRELIRLRREIPALSELSRENLQAGACNREQALLVRRWSSSSEVCIILSFNGKTIKTALPLPAGNWRKLLDSAEERWLGSGSKVPAALASQGEVGVTLSPWECLLFEKVKED